VGPFGRRGERELAQEVIHDQPAGRSDFPGGRILAPVFRV
jgi:hypothetical protein